MESVRVANGGSMRGAGASEDASEVREAAGAAVRDFAGPWSSDDPMTGDRGVRLVASMPRAGDIDVEGKRFSCSTRVDLLCRGMVVEVYRGSVGGRVEGGVARIELATLR